MWEEVVLIAVALSFVAVDVVQAVRASLSSAIKRRRPPARPGPLWLWTAVLLHVFLVVSHGCGLWTWESVGLQARLWGWSLGAGLFAYVLCASLVFPLIFSMSPSRTAAQTRQVWGQSVRFVAVAWPRSQSGKIRSAVLNLVTLPARIVTFYGILIVGVSNLLGTPIAGVLVGGAIALVLATRLPGRNAVWHVLLYLVSVGLLFAGPGLLAVLVFRFMASLQANRLGLYAEGLRAWRRGIRTPANSESKER